MKKFYKAAASIALACGIMFCASGCSASPENVEYVDNKIVDDSGLSDYRFNIRDYYSDFTNVKIIIDTQTGVQYIFHKSGYGGGMTVLLDSDGSPLLVEGAEMEDLE